jgi:hypothetical protein
MYVMYTCMHTCMRAIVHSCMYDHVLCVCAYVWIVITNLHTCLLAQLIITIEVIRVFLSCVDNIQCRHNLCLYMHVYMCVAHSQVICWLVAINAVSDPLITLNLYITLYCYVVYVHMRTHNHHISCLLMFEWSHHITFHLVWSVHSQLRTTYTWCSSCLSHHIISVLLLSWL